MTNRVVVGLASFLSMLFAYFWMKAATSEIAEKEKSVTVSYPEIKDQARCDKFYEIFAGVNDEKGNRNNLFGKTTKQIYDLLGEPTRVGILEYKGVRWLEVMYHFEICPSAVSKSESEAYRKGWTYAPTIIFRNGISVPFHEYVKEVELLQYSVTPKYLLFKEGGTFP